MIWDAVNSSQLVFFTKTAVTERVIEMSPGIGL